MTEALLERMRGFDARDVFISEDRATSYAELLDQVAAYRQALVAKGVPAELRQSVIVQGDYGVELLAMFLAVLAVGGIAVPIPAEATAADLAERARICQASLVLRPDIALTLEELDLPTQAVHPMLQRLLHQRQAGFVVFSSGSSGEPKAALHVFERFCGHLLEVRKAFRTLAFLLFDHIAGIDTALYTWFAGGTLVLPPTRRVPDVIDSIERQQVEVLPASPTFLRMLALHPAAQPERLKSLKIITFGAEPVSLQTINRIESLVPGARLIQKYGTTEFGSPRTRTRDGDGTWIRLDSATLQSRVLDGLLWIKTESLMEGYLNAPSPQIIDGWMNTGDQVEQDGEWYRILGRASEMINVGGEKVFPAEVEAVIEQLPEVESAIVYGVAHPILGQVLQARVALHETVGAEITRLVRSYCRANLEPYKVPLKVSVSATSLRTERQKKNRS